MSARTVAAAAAASCALTALGCWGLHLRAVADAADVLLEHAEWYDIEADRGGVPGATAAIRAYHSRAQAADLLGRPGPGPEELDRLMEAADAETDAFLADLRARYPR